MAVASSPSSTIAVPPTESSLTPRRHAADPLFEERWPAWRARGARHDLAVRRRLRVIVLIIAIAAGLVTLVGVISRGAL